MQNHRMLVAVLIIVFLLLLSLLFMALWDKPYELFAYPPQ